MSPTTRRIAVLGAPGTGAAELAEQLRCAAALPPDWSVQATGSPSQAHHFALLMGLVPPPPDTPDANTAREAPCASGHPSAAQALAEQQQADVRLREQLDALGLPYRVVYGHGPQRLSQALLALGLSAIDSADMQSRAQAQFQLNRGRTPWSCDKCSDPDCEHRLFTGLWR